MRKALIVGIDHYTHLNDLGGCVNDAHAINAALERHYDGTVNFANPRLLVGTGPGQVVERDELRDAVGELFKGDSEIALLYFAGHGFVDDTGGFLCTSDIVKGDQGLALSDVMTWANTSGAKNKVVILDSCHSGVAGDHSLMKGVAEISDGVTVMTASTEDQYALETTGGSGVFTELFTDALNGAAANLLGDITPGSVYAHIDQSLGPWGQRPVFKTNVESFVSLRKTKPPIDLANLQALTTHFPAQDFELSLDPSYEPERTGAEDGTVPPPDPENTATFKVLQDYVGVNLVRPSGAPHMWHAAMENKACKLTVLGQHYWRLVDEGMI
ncbi:MAG TPA: caspase family protein [Solirubrobacterales bacterium]|nr:caspase family protein [Solirubrobacterales bacterium]